jgi:L-lysine 6-transaminase
MTKIPPKTVHETIGKHMLVDGMNLVFDLEKSHGSFIHDSLSGREVLDFFTFFASSPIGYNHPQLANPEFIEKLGKVTVNNITNSDLYTVEMASFVDTFSRIAIPDYLPHLFMVAGGGLAVENTLKAAMDWKMQKNFAKGYTHEVGSQILHFKEAFHGRTGYTLSLTNTSDPRKYQWFARFDWPRVINPKVTFPLNEENLAKVEKTEQLAINQIKTAICERGDDIAAIIIEPIQGEGGDNHFRPEFMRVLRQICDENDIFFIYDEVQSGVGLTGKMWCHQHFEGAYPDAISFGKKSQVCGILVGNRIEEVERNVFVESSRLNSTWGGNLVDMVRFERYLEVIEADNLVDNAAEMGDYLKGKLAGIAEETPELISNVRGLGLMMAFDLPCGNTRDKLSEIAMDNGLAIIGCGDQTIRFRPPLNISREEVDLGIDILRKSLQQL